MSEPTHDTASGRVWYLRTGSDTDGAVHEQRVEYLPASPAPPAHLHPAQDEHFFVESGAMIFVVDGQARRIATGEEITVTRGTPHLVYNASDTQPAVVRWQTRPALRTTEFFSTVAALGDDAALLDRALLAHEYRDVFRLVGPSRFAAAVLGRIARLLGRRLP